MRAVASRISVPPVARTSAASAFVLGSLAAAAALSTWLCANVLLRSPLLADDALVTGSVEKAASSPVLLQATGAVLAFALALYVKRTGRLAAAAIAALCFALAASAAAALAGTAPAWIATGLVGAALGALATRIAMTRRPAARAEREDEATLWQSRQGSLVAASRGAHELLGCDRDALIGDGLFALVHVQDRVAFRQALDGAASDPSPTRSIRLMDEDGGVCGTFQMRCRPSVGQEAGEVVTTLRDVTSVAERIEALERARLDATQASEAKSRFIAVAAHELRTPLNAVIGFAELIRSGGAEQGPLPIVRSREYAGLIDDAGRHMLGLVEALLDMSRIEAGRYALAVETIEPAEAIARGAAMLEPVARERGVRIADVADRVIPRIEADPRALTQIVVNLLSNALKFAPRGSSVTLSAARIGEEIVLTVCDLGRGMSAADIERIGEPFVQFAGDPGRAAEGTGLGFSIVKGLVELHGGTLEIRSVEAPRPGHGTDVTVRLPMRHVRPRDGERVVTLKPAVGRAARDAETTSGRAAPEPNRSNEYGRVSA